MTGIEQAIDKIKGELKAFQQNNLAEDYGRLLVALHKAVGEWARQHIKETRQ